MGYIQKRAETVLRQLPDEDDRDVLTAWIREEIGVLDRLAAIVRLVVNVTNAIFAGVALLGFLFLIAGGQIADKNDQLRDERDEARLDAVRIASERDACESELSRAGVLPWP